MIGYIVTKTSGYQRSKTAPFLCFQSALEHYKNHKDKNPMITKVNLSNMVEDYVPMKEDYSPFSHIDPIKALNHV